MVRLRKQVTGLITQHMSSMYVITNYLDDPQKQQPKIVLFSKKLFYHIVNQM